MYSKFITIILCRFCSIVSATELHISPSAECIGSTASFLCLKKTHYFFVKRIRPVFCIHRIVNSIVIIIFGSFDAKKLH